MFVNLETTVVQQLINAQAESKWNAQVARLLAMDNREMVVGRLPAALQLWIYDPNIPADPLAVDLYSYALKRVDFYTIALQLVQATETHKPCQIGEYENSLTAEQMC
jgi:hypothetical protein